jgi:hypothetical protein
MAEPSRELPPVPENTLLGYRGCHGCDSLLRAQPGRSPVRAGYLQRVSKEPSVVRQLLYRQHCLFFVFRSSFDLRNNLKEEFRREKVNLPPEVPP